MSPWEAWRSGPPGPLPLATAAPRLPVHDLPSAASPAFVAAVNCAGRAVVDRTHGLAIGIVRHANVEPYRLQAPALLPDATPAPLRWLEHAPAAVGDTATRVGLLMEAIDREARLPPRTAGAARGLLRGGPRQPAHGRADGPRPLVRRVDAPRGAGADRHGPGRDHPPAGARCAGNRYRGRPRRGPRRGVR